MKRKTVIFLLVVFLAIGTCSYKRCTYFGFGEALALDAPAVETASESGGSGVAMPRMAGGSGLLPPPKDVNRIARRPSVQLTIEKSVGVLLFTSPYVPPEEKPEARLSDEDVEEKARAIVADELERMFARWEKYLTDIETCDYKPVSDTRIPLEAVIPEGTKAPERVVVFYKTKTSEVDTTAKKSAPDVQTISDTLNVSVNTAKTLINSLDLRGYKVTKAETDTSSEVTIMWFDDGWNDKYPTTLDWEISLHGSKANIITGYANGVIEVKPVPEDEKVCVKAGYHDIKSKFKIKPNPDVLRLQDKVKELEKAIDAKKQKYEYKKRSIRYVTMRDFFFGRIKMLTFKYTVSGSGVYIGDKILSDRMTNDVQSFQSEWGGVYRQLAYPAKRGLILTNAHVAQETFPEGETYVTKDEEVMWWIGPGRPSVRYTVNSDMEGSAAHLLYIDGRPVLSVDLDTAIMTTTAMPGLQKFKAILGNSDLVTVGDPVISVGSPAGYMKFTTRGVVSSTNHKSSNGVYFDYALKHGMSKARFLRGENANFWIDTPIGVGGISGSGVWSIKPGPNFGKMIALRNSGLQALVGMAPVFGEANPVDFKMLGINEYSNEMDEPLINGFFHKYRNKLFPKRMNRYQVTMRDTDIKVKFPTFKDALASQMGYVSIAGMNAGIPINKVKMFLQERGLDPEAFGWDGLDEEYFAQ